MLSLINFRAEAKIFGPHPWDVPVHVRIERESDANGHLTKLSFGDFTRRDIGGWVYYSDGGLSFMLKLEGDRPDAPRALRGRDIFRLALHEFGGRVRFIRGTWLATETYRSVNLEIFNRLTARGLDHDAAALATWTGRMAARHGFGVPREQFVTGPGGAFTSVRYTFERPSACAQRLHASTDR